MVYRPNSGWARRDVLAIAASAATPTSLIPSVAAASSEAVADTAYVGTKAYGSGYFGEWVTDEWGGVAYRYDCDQLHDPKALTPTDPLFRDGRDHWHQLGNDRIVATASNFGHLQVRQDEGGPKFLNDYLPTEAAFGGGLGYASDGETIVGTCYGGAHDRFQRTFGLGYVRKIVDGGGISVDQTIFAPFGDDPVLRSRTTLTNRRAEAVDLLWTDYWGCRPYQFFTPDDGNYTQTETHFARRIFGKQFRHDFERVPGGLIERKTYIGNVGFVPEGDGGSRRRDTTPPATFFVNLESDPVATAVHARPFFVRDGASPPGAHRALDGLLGEPEGDCLLVQRRIRLQPSESRTLDGLYGYETADLSCKALVAKYRVSPATQLQATVRAWSGDGLKFNTPSAAWVSREMVWSNYYLRSGATYDSFFEEHIISQGHTYQYINGGQAAARDPLYHAAPLIFSRPELVKSVLRYTLKELRPDGGCPYSVVSHGILRGAIDGAPPTDPSLWILWLASDYVLGTRDKAFLDETISIYPVRGPKAKTKSVRAQLDLAYRFLRDQVGVGEHGLMRLGGGDWNDNLVLERCPEAARAECQAVGESVLNAAMASYIFRRYAELRRFDGASPDEADAIAADGEAQRQAVAKQWTGRWFRRAWFGPTAGWIGDGDNLWLEPQPWGLIGGSTTIGQARTLCDSFNRELRAHSPIGATLINRSNTEVNSDNRGIAEDGGVWPSMNALMVWALAKTDPAAAWDEFCKNSLARHAEAYPNVWYGIWSGPDTYNSIMSPYPGQTMLSDLIRKPGAIMDHVYSRDFGMTDFPIMNMHPHATQLFAVTKLVGTEFTADGVVLEPSLPLRDYVFSSPLLGLSRAGDRWSGWYAPSVTGRYRITLKLPQLSRVSLDLGSKLYVNGKSATFEANNKEISFFGFSERKRPLQWNIT